LIAGGIVRGRDSVISADIGLLNEVAIPFVGVYRIWVG